MHATAIQKLLDGTVEAGSPVAVEGWVRTRRDSKAGFSFIDLHDGSGFSPIQIVASTDLPNYEQEIRHLTSGCAIRAEGTLVESRGRGQAYEIQAAIVEVVGGVSDPDRYPIQPKRHSFEYLREVAHLRPRTNTFGAMTRVRHRLARAIHEFFDEEGFFWINTPIITAADAEGAGELFRVSTFDLLNTPRTEAGQVDFQQDFFGKPTYLTVSGQLNVESFCLALSKVYTFGPTFRAENSNTSRHLAEFWMIEPEIAFADLDDLAALAEAFLQSIFRKLLEHSGEDLAFFAERIESTVIERLEKLSAEPFMRIDYAEAIDILDRADRTFDYPVQWGLDLQTEHERYLTEQYAKKPVVVMNYPREIKAFYMRCNDDGRTVAALDVLAPGIGEIIGGSQREERLDVLESRMKELELPTEPYEWYLDLRRYGSVPHAGFGLGFERLLSYVTGMSNLRDAIPFPRTPGSAPF